MAKPKVKAVAETDDIDLSSPPSNMQDTQAGAARAAHFLREEQARTDARRAARNPPPPRVLTDEERAQVAAENAGYVSLMMRVPAHGVRGWPAGAPVRRGSSASKSGPSA